VSASADDRGTMVCMRRWRKLGWFGPSKKQLRRAEEAVRAVRENRLRDAAPADTAKAEEVADDLFDDGPTGREST
jgi:hypothetical protein